MEINKSEQRWMEKKMYGLFYREVSEDADRENMWCWLRKGDLKPETKALIMQPQEQALRTKLIMSSV